jgi:hypothetical protein
MGSSSMVVVVAESSSFVAAVVDRYQLHRSRLQCPSSPAVLVVAAKCTDSWMMKIVDMMMSMEEHWLVLLVELCTICDTAVGIEQSDRVQIVVMSVECKVVHM